MSDPFGQIRPLLSIAGSLLNIIGLIDAAGVQIPQVGDGLRLAIAGFLVKNI